MSQRFLIVNADDFGQSPGVNRGVVQAHAHGIVTSASLMVRWPAAADAALYAREHPSLSLGLHLDLGEWAYRDEAWTPLYAVVPLNDGAAVKDEVLRQVKAFSRLTGRDPSHIDSHQHVHREEPVRSVLSEVAETLGVPLRDCGQIKYCGDFYGQTAEGWRLPDAISVDALVRIVTALRPGVTELGCHPGVTDDLDTMYRGERAEELKALCDARVRAAVTRNDIALRSFHDFRSVALA